MIHFHLCFKNINKLISMVILSFVRLERKRIVGFHVLSLCYTCVIHVILVLCVLWVSSCFQLVVHCLFGLA